MIAHIDIKLIDLFNSFLILLFLILNIINEIVFNINDNRINNSGKNSSAFSNTNTMLIPNINS